MVLTLGIDEAGRGPCVGSMFIVGAMFEEQDLVKLKNLGVKDSKLLTHKRRVELEKSIKKIAKKIKIIKVSPKEIDEAVESDSGLNLNWLEALKQAEIINELKPDKVIIDCPSPNIKKYTDYLKERIKKELVDKIIFVVEHKADVNFVECSSASIVAKVMRENEVKDIERMVGESIGSGYTSNPICQQFIKDKMDKYPKIFRKSWLTYKNHKKIKEQKTLDTYDNLQ